MYDKGTSVPIWSTSACMLCGQARENMFEMYDCPGESGKGAPLPCQAEYVLQVWPPVLGMFPSNLEKRQYDGVVFSI